MEVRTGRFVNEQPPVLFAEHTDRFIVDDDDMDSDTVAESEMFVKSRSFLNRVNEMERCVPLNNKLWIVHAHVCKHCKV